MKTLIELYDERPVENILSTEVFRPERTVILCPVEVARNKSAQSRIRRFLTHRGIDTELVFLETGIYDTEKIEQILNHVIKAYPDCVLDITGGTDAALFAGGLVCAKSGLPAFTYSRKRNRFFNIHNAPFADELECRVEYSVEDCFLVAGGAMRTGRVDNSVLSRYMDSFDSFFKLYMKYKSCWNRIVGFMQRASQPEKDGRVSLKVRAPYRVKGERGGPIPAPEDALRDFERLGYISGLVIVPEKSVSFRFKDLQIRAWLRDVGSVLELYVYKACIDAGAFADVRTSVVVDWEGGFGRENVTNEIDVMATRGTIPLFISCKTCAITTEALNELAVLRGRFGGKFAQASAVTSQRCRAITRHRAAELNIKIIDGDDLRGNYLKGDYLKTDGLKGFLAHLYHANKLRVSMRTKR